MSGPPRLDGGDCVYSWIHSFAFCRCCFVEADIETHVTSLSTAGVRIVPIHCNTVFYGDCELSCAHLIKRKMSPPTPCHGSHCYKGVVTWWNGSKYD